MAHQPNVLIFGSLNFGTACILAQYLLQGTPGERLAAYVRIVDKYSINPPTTYVSKDFLKLINERKDVLEYRQANLINPDVVSQCFTPPPNGRPFTHIFDITGSYSLTTIHEIQIMHTFKISLNIAREAAQRGVKAYVRVSPSFYDHKDPKEKFVESDPKGWKPLDVRGVWFHEALRAIGAIPALPLVALRHGHIYGQGIVRSECTSAIVFGKVYNKANRTLTLYLPGELRKNTIHLYDLAVAAWKSAEWIASITRQAANAIAGVQIPSSGDPEVVKAPEALPSSALSAPIPIFNVVDGADTTHHILSNEVGSALGVVIESSPIRLTDEQYNERIEDLNGYLYGQWLEIITTSNPPVPDTPLSPYVTVQELKEHGCALDGSKIRQVLSFTPRYPKFGQDSIKEYVEWCKTQGIWPQ